MPDYTGQSYLMDGQDNGATIAATDSFTIGEVTGTGRVTEVTYTPEAASTGDNTHYRTYTLVNKGATGVGTTVIATLALTLAVDLVAFDEKAATLTATVADRVVTAGDILAWVSTPTGNGLVDPGGTVKVTIERAAA